MKMKKVMVGALVGILSIGTVLSVSAAEEETAAEQAAEPAKIIWDEKMQDLFVANGYTGEIFTIDKLGMQILIPDGLEQRQPTDEEKEQDTVLVFDNEDSEDKIELVLGPVGDCKTLEDVRKFIEDAYPDVTVLPTLINEYETLMYGSEATNSMTVLIGAGDAGFLRIIMRPVNDPEKNQLYSFVAASIKMMDEEETQASEEQQ